VSIVEALKTINLTIGRDEVRALGLEPVRDRVGYVGRTGVELVSSADGRHQRAFDASSAKLPDLLWLG
jgi:hypothetical protein